MCYCDDYESPRVYEEKIVVARKDHKCSECRTVIPKGEQYKRITGLWDGHWSTYRHCHSCHVLIQVAEKEDREFCYPLGMLFYTLRECDLGHLIPNVQT